MENNEIDNLEYKNGKLVLATIYFFDEYCNYGIIEYDKGKYNFFYRDDSSYMDDKWKEIEDIFKNIRLYFDPSTFFYAYRELKNFVRQENGG